MEEGLLPWVCRGPAGTVLNMRPSQTELRDRERSHNYQVSMVYKLYNRRLSEAPLEVRMANSYLPIPSVTLGPLAVGVQPLTEAAMRAFTVEDWFAMAVAWPEATDWDALSLWPPIRSRHVMRRAYQEFISAYFS